MTVGSLFAGIGGIDLAAERVGMVPAWQVEIDDDATRVLAHHWPDVTRHDDVTTWATRKNPAASVDLIVGGFPCQDLSVAGKRKGLAGKRSGLFGQMVRIIHRVRPAFVLWENVPGLLSSDDGRDFVRVMRALADIGYSGGWRALDAQRFGVPQRRRRVFGVFARGRAGAGRAAEILALTQGGGRHPETCGEAREGVAATLRSRSHRAGVNPPGRGGEDDANLIVSHTLTGQGFDASEDGTGRGTPFDWQSGGAHGRLNCSGKTVSSLQCSQTPAVAYTLKAAHRGIENGWQGNYVAKPLGVRRLMPIECLRLQGFPDNWLDISPELSDIAKYRLIGNSVAVPCVQWIMRRMAGVAA